MEKEKKTYNDKILEQFIKNKLNDYQDVKALKEEMASWDSWEDSNKKAILEQYFEKRSFE